MSKKKHNAGSTPAITPVETDKTPLSLQGLSMGVVIAVLFAITFIFFLPFIFSSDMIYGSDALNGIYTKIYYKEFFAKFHTFPRLLALTLSGMPSVDAFFGDVFYPPVVLQFIMSIPKALGYKYMLSVFIAGVFTFLFLFRGLNLRKDVSLLFAFCFMFNTEFISHMFPGHDGKMFVISLLPLSLFALKRLMDTRRLSYAVLLALGIGLCLLTSHVQTTYFSLWGFFFYFLFETIGGYQKDKNRRLALSKSGLFTLAVVLGLCLGMVQFLPPYKFTKQYSVRGDGDKTSYEHATSWSIHPEETASLIVPEFCGFQDKGDTGVNYWGRNPFKLNNEYAGIVVLLFTILFAGFFRKDRFVLFWLLVALGSLIFALGADTPIFYLFYYFVPGVKLFRAPSMIMFWFAIALCITAAYGLNRFLSDDKALHTLKEGFARKVMIVLLVCAGLTLIITAAQDLVLSVWKGIFFGTMSGAQSEAFKRNYPAFIKGAWFALLLGGGALFLFYLYLKDSLKKEALIILLMILASADLFRVNSYFYKLVNPDEYVNRNDPTLTDLAAKGRSDHFRVLPIPGHLGNNDAQIYGLESVLGFHDNELKWYRDFRGGQECTNFFYLLQQGKIEGNPFLDLLNVKYVIFRSGQNAPLTYAENRGALPRAFCVSDFETVREEDVTKKLRDPGFPYRTKILLEEAMPLSCLPDTSSLPAGRINDFKIEQEDRLIDVTLDRPGFVVLSEIFIPYWNAYEEGKKLKVYKTDLALMSVYLDKGKHNLRFKYESPYLALGAKITFLAAMFCILLLLADYRLSKKRKAADTPILTETKAIGV